MITYKDHCMSNGMLMRISPIGIVIAGYVFQCRSNNKTMDEKDYEKIKQLVKLDTYLSHYSEEALAYAVTYVILIAFSIVNGDMTEGIAFLDAYQDKKVGDWFKILSNGLSMDAKLAHDPKKQIGDSRIGLQLAIRKAHMM